MIAERQNSKNNEGDYMTKFAGERLKSYMPFRVSMPRYAACKL